MSVRRGLLKQAVEPVRSLLPRRQTALNHCISLLPCQSHAALPTQVTDSVTRGPCTTTFSIRSMSTASSTALNNHKPSELYVPPPPAGTTSVDLLRKEVIADARAGKLPEHLSVCRGCGAPFQTDSPDHAGYVPKKQYHAFAERIAAQLEAARQDLRVRSGGGQGMGTAVAAVHASLSTTLKQVTQESLKHSQGSYTNERLAAMGLDEHANPLPTQVNSDNYDVQMGLRDERRGVQIFDTKLAKEKSKQAREEYLHRLKHDREATVVPEPMKYSPDISHDAHGGDDDDMSSIKLDSAGNLIKEADLKLRAPIVDARKLSQLEKATKESTKSLRCERCHKLVHTPSGFGPIPNIPKSEFEYLLFNLFNQPYSPGSVLILLVDLFDLHGSFMRNIRNIVGGKHPILIAANKFDLLPRTVGKQRVQMWLHKQAKAYGLDYYSIHIISSTTGEGVRELMDKALLVARGKMSETAKKNRNIYVIGATNVGKSSFINKLLSMGIIGTGLPSDIGDSIGSLKKYLNNNLPLDAPGMSHSDATENEIEGNNNNNNNNNNINNNNDNTTQEGKDKDQNKDQNKGKETKASLKLSLLKEAAKAYGEMVPEEHLIKTHQELLQQRNKATISPIPGTTLGVVSYPVLERKRGGRAITVSDTPGILAEHQITSHLHYEEVDAVLPHQLVKPLTYRVKAGQSILLGALARIDVVSGRPFHFSSYVSPNVTVHIASTKSINKEYLIHNTGVTLFPPFTRHRSGELSIAESLAVDPIQIEIEEKLRKESEEERRKNIMNNNNNNGEEEGEEEGSEFDENEWLDRTDVAEDDIIQDDNTSLSSSSSSATKSLSPLEKERQSKIDRAQTLIPVATSTVNGLEYPARAFLDGYGNVVYQLKGAGWNQCSHDIVISGLGWVSVCGSGPLTLRVAVTGSQPDLSIIPKDTGVTDIDLKKNDKLMNMYWKAHIRDPLMPFDTVRDVSRYTGTPLALKMKSKDLAHTILAEGNVMKKVGREFKAVVYGPKPPPKGGKRKRELEERVLVEAYEEELEKIRIKREEEKKIKREEKAKQLMMKLLGSVGSTSNSSSSGSSSNSTSGGSTSGSSGTSTSTTTDKAVDEAKGQLEEERGKEREKEKEKKEEKGDRKKGSEKKMKVGQKGKEEMEGKDNKKVKGEKGRGKLQKDVDDVEDDDDDEEEEMMGMTGMMNIGQGRGGVSGVSKVDSVFMSDSHIQEQTQGMKKLGRPLKTMREIDREIKKINNNNNTTIDNV